MYRSAGEKGVAGSLGPSGESGVQPDNEVWVSYGRKSPASDGLKLDVAHKNNAMKPGIVVFQRRFDFTLKNMYLVSQVRMLLASVCSWIARA